MLDIVLSLLFAGKQGSIGQPYMERDFLHW